MRGIDEETLLAVRKSLAAEGLNTDVIDALISLKIRELNQWMTLEEFLKSGFEGLCVIENIAHEFFLCFFDLKFFRNQYSNCPINDSTIIKVFPIHKLEPPQDEI